MKDESTYQRLLQQVDLVEFNKNPHGYTVSLKYLAECIDGDKCMTVEEYREWLKEYYPTTSCRHKSS